MWPAPTAEDWKRPVLIQWQRTWEDALAVAKETGKPILICVNMDGEIASEHYAGKRYREPEKAKLYEPYVTVIASVYRHSVRDFDEQGRRIPCPRFGGVTCGEHMAIEPILYEQFFDGRRVAPRHIMVELDGKESYDVYYTWDTDSVFKAIREGIANRKAEPRTLVRGDRTILERVASRDSKDRSAVELAYEKGGAELRRKLLEAAEEHSEASPVGLLRLAVFGFDTELGKLARQALAKQSSPSAIDVINEALAAPMEPKEHEGLVAALARIGKSSSRARTLAVVHRGLDSDSSSVDVAGWAKGIAGAEYPAPEGSSTLASRIDETEARAKKRPDSGMARLELAEATLELAAHPGSSRRVRMGTRSSRTYAQLLMEDAYSAALEAERQGAEGWRVDAAIAVAANGIGKRKEAYERAEAAVEKLPAGETGRNALAVLEIFAHGRQRAIGRAVWRKEEWPPEWLTDLHSAHAVLARHPLGTVRHVADHYDFLKWLGAWRQAWSCLEQGLARFPESWLLHDRLRGRLLKERGPAGLEDWYEKRLEEPNASPNLRWFAGLSSIVAAEFHRRAGRIDEALAAYGRAIAHYERGVEARPDTHATADHYVALALAGRARIALEGGDYQRALEELLASFERKESAAATQDGLNISPVDTARMLLRRLEERELAELAGKLQKALDDLPPELLELPAYERRVGRRGQRRGPRRRR